MSLKPRVFIFLLMASIAIMGVMLNPKSSDRTNKQPLSFQPTDLPAILKRVTLKTYGDQLAVDRVEFAQRHEAGLEQYLSHERTMEQAGREQGLSSLGTDNLVTTLHALIADWSSGLNGYAGPIRHIMQDNDPNMAQHRLLIYLSDNCVLDEADHLSLQAQIKFAIMLAHAENRGRLNLAQLRDTMDTVYTLMSTTCESTMQGLQDIVESANYQIGENMYGYSFMENSITRSIKDETPDTSAYYTAKMHNELLRLSQFARSDWKRAQTFMQAQEQTFKQQLLQQLDPDAAAQFGHDLEAYIMNQLKKHHWL